MDVPKVENCGLLPPSSDSHMIAYSQSSKEATKHFRKHGAAGPDGEDGKGED